ncbi:hypothetical protein KKC88_00870 [Patescibacteria group bacterium]|nr:hypothetical protein [Patescibacteria group bacterium]MBU1673311.1 hypothetical protein [Patescibacteria group bacterium]MBU1963570.1 hypothetical protein [Patescibacteria group bacterium]
MANVPGYVRGSGGKKTYSVGGNTIVVEDEINDITLRSVFEAINQDPEIPKRCALSKNAFGPVNGQYFYFPSKGGGLLSRSSSRLIKPTR